MARKRRGGTRPQEEADKGLPEEFEMEEDALANTKILHLETNEHVDDGDEDEFDDEVVYDIGDDDDYDTDEEADMPGRLGDLARAEKQLRRKLMVSKGEADDDEDDRQDDDEDDVGDERNRDALWGKSKRAYYSADNVDMELTDDEDAPQEEEEEARRLQKRAVESLTAADFDLDDDDNALDGDAAARDDADARDTMLEEAAAAQGPYIPTAVEMEQLDEEEMAGVGDEAKLAAIMADAPELLALLSDLQTTLADLRGRVGPLLAEVKQGGLATDEGVSYLEAKQLLLLNYCSNIVFYLLLKAEGRSVRDHPVIMRLVQIRAYLEKLRPIDKKLQYQMDKLLKAAQKFPASANGAAAADDDKDALRYKPNPAAMTADDDGDNGGMDDDDGVYRPPKLNPVAMPEDDDDVAEKRSRKDKALQRKVRRSEMMQDLIAELEGAPEEVRDELAPGLDTRAALRERARLEARLAAEEEMMTRFIVTKEEKKRLKAAQRQGLSGAGLDDFADDVAGVLDAVGAADGNAIDPLFLRHRTSQMFGATDTATKRGTRTGDEDLPIKAPLHERRARYDSVKAAQLAALERDEEERSAAGAHKRHREEDEFYQEAKAAAESKKKAKQAAYSWPASKPPKPDAVADGTRGVGQEILKNRGLTPHRRKDIKNPRKKNRMKHDKALVRRKGQVQDVRQQTANYGGESTGVKTKVSKSVKF